MSDTDNCCCGGGGRRRSPTTTEYGVIIGVIFVVVVYLLIEITKGFTGANCGAALNNATTTNSTKTPEKKQSYFFLIPVGLPFLAVFVGGLVKLKRLHASGYFSKRKAKNKFMIHRGSVVSVSTVVSSSNTELAVTPAQPQPQFIV